MFVDADGTGEVEHRFASDFYFDLRLRYTGSLLLTLIPVVAEGVQCNTPPGTTILDRYPQTVKSVDS